MMVARGIGTRAASSRQGPKARGPNVKNTFDVRPLPSRIGWAWLTYAITVDAVATKSFRLSDCRFVEVVPLDVV